MNVADFDDTSPERFVLVAGEPSGDALGAALIEALRRRFPRARFAGVAGAQMIDAGCQPWATVDELSVMGLAEVLRHLPRLLALRRRLARQIIAQRPDCLIGIDAPDFNLGLEQRVRAAGLRTVHVVSPTVWAWREGRVRTVVRAVDRLLVLFPFEQTFYQRHAIAVDYIGHPLADQIDAQPDPCPARSALGLGDGGPVLAVLPGSRSGEVARLAVPFARTVARLAQAVPGLRVVTPLARPALRAAVAAAIASDAAGIPWTLLDGAARQAMAAADAVLLASGTATLECLLIGRPMVVAYRVSPLSAALLRATRALKIHNVSLPNLLAGRPLVPEFLQEAVIAERMVPALYELLTSDAARKAQTQAFAAIREQLRRGAAAAAAAAVAQMIAR